MNTDNLNIYAEKDMITPKELKNMFPSNEVEKHIKKSRENVSNTIQLKNDRLVVVVWPCSIHNPKEWLEYARKLLPLQEENENLIIVMRVYFEKPRTTIGWKWLISDPNLNEEFEMEKWLIEARRFLWDVNYMWLAAATEFLNPIIAQYLADLISYGAIWARTTESQTHREMASWLSMPIWFKNATDGNINIAMNAIEASKQKNPFLGINNSWKVAIEYWKWRNDWHIILRGWENWPNYSSESTKEVEKELKKKWITTWIMKDASHGNSEKDYRKQSIVVEDIAEQIASWDKITIWVMIESNLKAWKQSFNPWKDNPNDLEHWVSITDGCIDIEETARLLKKLNSAVEKRRN